MKIKKPNIEEIRINDQFIANIRFSKYANRKKPKDVIRQIEEQRPSNPSIKLNAFTLKNIQKDIKSKTKGLVNSVKFFR